MLHTFTSSVKVASASTCVVRGARRNREQRVGNHPGSHLALRRLLREDQPDPRPVGARRAVGRVVHLEDQRRPCGNPLGHARQEHRRVFADRPVHEHLIAGARDGVPRGLLRARRGRTRRGRRHRRGRSAPGCRGDAIGRLTMTFGRGVGVGSLT